MAAEDKDLNRDPITDEPGAHPVGTGLGAAGGAVAGAAAGTVAGPVGTMVGGVIGAVVGGLAGKAAAEAINPTAEEEHWRENYSREPYYEQGRSFDDYRPAYMHGVQGRMKHQSDWDTAEPQLASEWENAHSGSGLSWEQARPATRAAWDRVDRQRGGEAGMGLGSTGRMGSDTAVVRANDLAGSGMAAGTDMGGDSMGMDQDMGGRSSSAGMGTTGMERGAATGTTGSGGMGTGTVGTDRTGTTTGTTTGMGSGTLGAAGMGGGTLGTSADRGGLGDDAAMLREDRDRTSGSGMGSQATGAAGMVGAAQSAGNMSADRDDVVDALQDLVACCKDGEYGFRECAEQAKDPNLKSVLLQRADDCRRGAEELNEQIRQCGGQPEQGGSAMGALHRGWVSVRSALSTYDDKAVLEECERGEDNALARYRKALKQPLPPQVKQVVERQYQQVQRNHDQVKMLRDQLRGQ